MPRILLIEDDLRLAEMVSSYLGEAGFTVTHAPTGNAGIALAGRDGFDALILDLMLPDIDGLEVCRRVRARAATPILMLTARGDAMDRVVGLEMGADDYLPKPFEPRELLLRIATILRRAGTPVEAQRQTLLLGACRFDPERGELTRNGNPVKLTSAELSLMRVMAASPGTTFTRSDLSQKMGEVLERTVDVQITRLRRKIENDPKMPLYLQTVRGIGYVLVPDRVG